MYFDIDDNDNKDNDDDDDDDLDLWTRNVSSVQLERQMQLEE